MNLSHYTWEEWQKVYLEDVRRRASSVGEAANILGMKYNTARRLLKKYNIWTPR